MPENEETGDVVFEETEVTEEVIRQYVGDHEVVEIVREEVTVEVIEEERPGPVRITVNADFVEMSVRKATGAEVKQAAIAAGVAIQLDFVLSEVRPNGHQAVIRDDREIHLKDGDEFWAIPGDDNS